MHGAVRVPPLAPQEPRTVLTFKWLKARKDVRSNKESWTADRARGVVWKAAETLPSRTEKATTALSMNAWRWWGLRVMYWYARLTGEAPRSRAWQTLLATSSNAK